MLTVGRANNPFETSTTLNESGGGVRLLTAGRAYSNPGYLKTAHHPLTAFILSVIRL